MKTNMKPAVRKTLSALILSVLFLPAMLHAQPRIPEFGFGIVLGEPTGLTLKGGLGGNNAWEASLGRSWFGSLRVHGTYLWAADVFNSSKAGLYFGLGGVMALGRSEGVVVKGRGGEWYYYEDEDAFAIGARGAMGVNLMPFAAPMEFSLELAPVVGLSPVTGVGLEGSLAFRYYP